MVIQVLFKVGSECNHLRVTIIISCDFKEIIIPLPCKFSDWDRDGDGKVNKIEFVSVTHARGRSKDVKYVFHSSDKNGKKCKVTMAIQTLLKAAVNAKI